ncbi:hypothetical protein [Verrucomicrobium spinosum]|uniref:hypothetical protein n=1 Tax=Verrucomicrobium spinosum TaxID=2736 RepID=UPI0001746AB7|nr:hypothetical protein [Verrucomicrobium spinosum]
MIKLLAILALTVSLFAEDVPEAARTASPDGEFRVTVAKVANTNTKRLEIRGKEEKILFSSPPRIDGTDILEFYPEHLRWSPDSRILAISAGYSKLFRTCLFAWDGKGFQQIPMPEIAAGEDNPWIYPVAWKAGHILHLKISGPHAGKAGDNGYEGTAVVQVELQKKTVKKLSEEVKRYGANK